MTDELKNRIAELVEKPLGQEGYELADIGLSRYKSNVTLKLYVYSVSPITIDECARLSRIVGDLLDGVDWFERKYTLEISSPGLNRPLTTARDFKYRVGETVRIMFAGATRGDVTAEIVAANTEAIKFRNSDGTFSVPLEEIDRARIIY
jgi:ribosome maturation factor RimP